MANNNKTQRMRRHMRIRKKVAGTADRPRFCVSITANNIYCQFINDEPQTGSLTLAAVSTLDSKFKAENCRPNLAGAVVLGKMAADAAKAAGITAVVFDRSGYRYHGRIKAIAETARENGLKF